MSATAATPVLGLRANAGQIALLLLITAFVGATVGLERTILPLIARSDFGLVSKTVALSFLVTFGLAKAVSNLLAGRLADHVGRRAILIAGWIAGIPVPVMIMYAPSWSWIVGANVLLGVNQGLCWSATIIQKIDLAGPERRGLAVGLNEFAGYSGVALSALMTGYLASAYGLRPAPFLPGVAFAVAGLALSVFGVRETQFHAQHDSLSGKAPARSFAQVFALTVWTHPSMRAVSLAGLVTKINDGLIWGLLPIYWATGGLTVDRIGILAATFPAVWGVAQIATGPASDRIGRKGMIGTGMIAQAAGIALFLRGAGFEIGVLGATTLALGTALVYPTLLAAVSDVAEPAWRASALGVYRLWRDGGFVAGGLAAGVVADLVGTRAAIGAAAAVTFATGIFVFVVMRETLRRE